LAYYCRANIYDPLCMFSPAIVGDCDPARLDLKLSGPADRAGSRQAGRAGAARLAHQAWHQQLSLHVCVEGVCRFQIQRGLK
jgi:hypothetical protein